MLGPVQPDWILATMARTVSMPGLAAGSVAQHCRTTAHSLNSVGNLYLAN